MVDEDVLNAKLDKIIQLLEQLVAVSTTASEQAATAAEEAELDTHRSGCKCGRC